MKGRLPRLCFYLLLFTFLPLSLFARSVQVRILYLNNVDGYLRACHCPGNLYGGLLYAFDLVDRLRNENPNTIFVDAGDLFPAKDWKPKAEFAIEFYNRMGLDALNIGDQEFWFGLNFLQQMQKKAHFTFLSANIYQNDSLLFAPYLIKSFEGLKIGIAGLLNPETFKLEDQEKYREIQLKNVEQTLQNILNTFEEQQVNVVIVLSHAGDEFDRKLAKTFPQIDFIIGAHSEKLFDPPVKVGQTAILQAEHYAHYLGVLDLTVNEKGNLKYQNRLLKLESVPVVQEAAEIYQRYMDASDALVDSLSKVASNKSQSYKANPKPSDCGSCHFEEYDQWSRTPHAFAWQTIAEDGRTNDVSCISCHTTRFGKKGGFVNTEITPELVNVGCVSCHTDFAGHPDEHESMNPVEEKTCKACHDRPNSPDFVFADYRKAVLHELDYYTIRPGDWLSKLAGHFYNDVRRWPTIYRANRLDINNPHLIFPGQKIVIPRIPQIKTKKAHASQN